MLKQLRFFSPVSMRCACLSWSSCAFVCVRSVTFFPVVMCSRQRDAGSLVTRTTRSFLCDKSNGRLHPRPKKMRTTLCAGSFDTRVVVLADTWPGGTLGRIPMYRLGLRSSGVCRVPFMGTAATKGATPELSSGVHVGRRGHLRRRYAAGDWPPAPPPPVVRSKRPLVLFSLGPTYLRART